MTKKIDNHKSKNPFKRVPWYGWVSAVVMIFLFMGLYKIAGAAAEHLVNGGYWSYCPKIDAIDNCIPFVPYFFIQIYVLAYGVWVVTPIILSTGDKKHFINFMIAAIVAHLIGFTLFIAMPSYMDRVAEGLEKSVNNIQTPFTKFLMSMIIGADGSAIGWNMAPSFHVLTSLLCILGLMRRKDIHIIARIIVEVLCVLVIMSTVFVKQHYFIDVIYGLALGGVVWSIVMIFKPGQLIMNRCPNFLVIKRKNKKVNHKNK